MIEESKANTQKKKVRKKPEGSNRGPAGRTVHTGEKRKGNPVSKDRVQRKRVQGKPVAESAGKKRRKVQKAAGPVQNRRILGNTRQKEEDKGKPQDRKLLVFKYGATALLLGYVVLLLFMTAGSSKPFETIQKAVEDSLDTTTLSKTKTQGLKRYYGLNAADYDGVMLYVSQSSMSAEEVLLIKVKNNEQIDRVEEAVYDREDSRRSDFEGYAPDEVELIDNSVLSVRGNYIFFTISKNASQYKSAFTKSL